MAWVRLDDQFFFHAKVTEVSDGACLLYLVALTQCNAALTDGVLTPARLHICAAVRGLADEEQLAAELVAAGLWERKRGGWCIHDYGRYQPTSTVIKKRRVTDAQRQAGRRERRRAEAANHDESHAVTHAGQPANVVRESVRPNPNPNPNPPLVNAPLPPTADGAEEDEERAQEPRPIRAIPKPKEIERAATESHPLFEPLVTLFGKPPARELTAWREHLDALDDVGAQPEEIPRAADAYRAIMGSDTTGRPILLTPAALIRHWYACMDAISTHDVAVELHRDQEAGAVAWARRYGYAPDQMAEASP